MTYKHWSNVAGPGDMTFVTTTAEGFRPVLEPEGMRDLTAALLLSDCRRYGADLHAYVVMKNHLHLLLRCPEGRDIRWMMQRLKSNSAKVILREVDAGSRPRGVWRKGFRSVPVVDEQSFWRKVAYIHGNAVRAGLCEQPEGYRWSSASLFADGLWAESRGLDLEAASRLYPVPPESLFLRSGPHHGA